jgi:hypothetical protein
MLQFCRTYFLLLSAEWFNVPSKAVRLNHNISHSRRPLYSSRRRCLDGVIIILIIILLPFHLSTMAPSETSLSSLDKIIIAITMGWCLLAFVIFHLYISHRTVIISWVEFLNILFISSFRFFLVLVPLLHSL